MSEEQMTPDEEIRLLAELVANLAHPLWRHLPPGEQSSVVIGAMKVMESAQRRVVLADKLREGTS